MSLIDPPFKRLEKKMRRGFLGHPLATVAFYGPTNEFATKVAVSIVPGPEREPTALQRWFGDGVDVRSDLDIGSQVLAFINANTARSVVMSRGIIGCPHEEGVDYPLGESCPRCPFWQGRDRWKDV